LLHGIGIQAQVFGCATYELMQVIGREKLSLTSPRKQTS
jgi:hypothetical protein